MGFLLKYLNGMPSKGLLWPKVDKRFKEKSALKGQSSGTSSKF
jgi:hypothetical protein